MLKILFLIPPYFNPEDFLNPQKSSFLPSFTIPYGVLSLESYIKSKCKKEINIELLDLNIEAYKIIKNGLKSANIRKELMVLLSKKLELSTDIVAISSLFNNSYEYLGEMVEAIKKNKNKSLCLIGGGLATNLYDRLLVEFPLIDGACFAEGEIPFLDLINSNNFKDVLRNHPSWMTKETLKEGKIPKASFVENLDDIPSFDYKILDLKYYNGRSLDKQHCNDKNKIELSIHTSRGCQFNCVFCANSSVHGKKIRYMSVRRVISEVDNMIRNFAMNVLLIEDDHFLSNKKRAVRILSEISKRNIRIEFPNGMAVYAIDNEIGKLLKEAGTINVQLAIESCCDYVLKEIINKPHTVSMIKPAVEILRNNGIKIHAFIVLGLPGEMDNHRKETLDGLKKIGFDWVYFFIATPIVGSRLYKICLKNNYLVEKNFKNHIVSKGCIKAPGVDPKKIEETSYTMNLDVNFINNYNFLSGNIDKALPYFEHVSKKYPKHAFAHYMLGKIYAMKKMDRLSKEHHQIFLKIIDENKDWQLYANKFNLLKSK